MKKSVGMNAMINGIKTVLSLIFPLITYPYITRVLQVDAIGQYNFSRSFINYFYLIASLGISTYAIREGSRLRDDINRLSEFASEVFTINTISMSVSYVLLFITVLLFDRLKPYSALLAVLSISMLFTTLGCEWIFNIFEEYLYIAIRTIICLLCSLLMLFLFVKTKEDVVKYAGILVFSSSGANIINYFIARKKCRIRFRLSSRLIRHIKPIIVLWANSIATTVYVNSDIVILGLLTSDYHSGIYSLSSKIYSIIKQVLSAMIIVSIPRFSWLIGKGDHIGFNKLASTLLGALMTFVFPCAVGLYALSTEIILTLSTEEFIASAVPLRILCVALLFCMFTWFYTSCVLIPYKRERTVLISTMLAASINVILNFILIPVMKESAAALTTAIAEAVALIICFIKSIDLVKIDISVKDLISVGIGCGLIYIVCVIVTANITSPIMAILMSVIVSVLVYAIVLHLFKNRSLEYFLQVAKSKLKKNS